MFEKLVSIITEVYTTITNYTTGDPVQYPTSDEKTRIAKLRTEKYDTMPDNPLVRIHNKDPTQMKKFVNTTTPNDTRSIAMALAEDIRQEQIARDWATW